VRENWASSSGGLRGSFRARRLLPLVLPVVIVVSMSASSATARRAAAPTLVVDNSFALDTSDPQREFDPTSAIIDHAVYESMFTYRGGDVAHPVPLLVKSWTSSRARTFTFRLQRNVRFADGTPLTAADVVFSLRRLANLHGPKATLVTGNTVAANGRYTVIVKTATPEPQLLAVLANPATGIVNSRLVREHGGSDAPDASKTDTAESWFNSANSAGAGSGPYVVDSYDPSSQVTLRANPRYWGPTKRRFGAVVIRNMSAPAQLLNIRRGAHQIAIDLSPAQAETLKADKALRVAQQSSVFTFYAFTNEDPAVSTATSNRRFQQAFREALDYQGAVLVAGPGAIQAPGIIPSTIPGALPQKNAAKQNLQKAKADLDASGVGAEQLTLEYPSDLTITGVSFATLAQKLLPDLSAAGFHVTLSGSPVTTFQAKYRAGKVAFGLWIYGPVYPDPSDYLSFTPGGFVASHVNWNVGSDPAIDQLAAQARATTAPAARVSLYQVIQRALNERGPFMPLVQPAVVLVATNDLAGVVYNNVIGLDITQVSPK
jgi:peptide/nickel transport system substrate-binding protein